jgi:hypothetical protein
MRALVPLRAVLKDFTSALFIILNTKSLISTVWEDNQGALILATTNPP